jgi:hypothetical protein
MYTENSEQIQSVIIAQDTLDGLAELAEIINPPEFADIVQIDPRNLFCQKTGNIIGKRDENSLFLLAKIYGKQGVLSHSYHSVGLNTHPAWILTDSLSLDILIESDPVGFCCYMLGEITKEFFQNHKNQNPKLLPAIERHWALARANGIISTRGIAELSELNLELCKFRTYEEDTKKHLFRKFREHSQSPDTLAMLATTGELTGILRSITLQVLAAIGNASYSISGRDIYDYRQRLKKAGELDTTYKTPVDASSKSASNIRGMKASKRDVKEAGLFNELAKLFGDEGLNTIGETNLTYARREEFNRKEILRASLNDRIKTATADPFDFDLSALDNLNLDLVEAPNEADENDVEVRFVAQEIAPLEEPSTLQIPNNMLPDAIYIVDEQIIVIDYKTTQPLTLREKLAARLAGAK